MLLLTSGPSAFAQSQTGQSIMVSVTPSTPALEIEGTTTWTYHRDDCAATATYYTANPGVWNGAPPTCTGSSTNCAADNQPAVPSAPAVPTTGPDSVSNHAQDDRCIFFCGGTLPGWSYTQTRTVSGLNGKGNWTFTYNYTTTTAGAVAAGTCWASEVTGGTGEVTYNGFVSSESCVQKSGGTWQRKYSFTLLNSDLSSRVVNVSAQLQKETPTGSGNWLGVGDPIAFGSPLPVSTTVNDYSYFGNGGVFGKSTVFPLLHGTGGGKLANLVTNILTGTSDGTAADNFSGNDNDLSAGNVHQADFGGSFTFGIGDEGNYRVAVTGTLKGNTAAGVPDVNFSVTSNLVTVGGCGC